MILLRPSSSSATIGKSLKRCCRCYFRKLTKTPSMYKSNCSWMYYKINAVNSFENFTWKHLCWTRFLLFTARKMKFSIKDFFSKCDQIRSFLRIRSHLLKKSLMENFIFCTVVAGLRLRYFLVNFSKILRYFYRTPPWGCFCFIWDSLTLIFLANVSLLYVARYIFPWSGRFHRNTIFHPMPVVWFIISSVKIEIIRYSPIIPKPLPFGI